MDVNIAMDQYEKQLFALFTSYDSNHNGNLTKEALQELCNALQLEDRGRQLINLLCKDDGECNISFQEFRDGLLTVLGDESYDRPSQKVDQNENHSEGDSSGREVSPKYVFGSKKYGRRSRPTFKVDSVDLITGNSHGTGNLQYGEYNVESISKDNKKTSKVRRSISLNEERRSNYFDFNSLDQSPCVTHLSVTKVENIECASTSPYTTHNLDCNSNTQKTLRTNLSYNEASNQLVENSIEVIGNQQLESLHENTSMEDSIPSENIVDLWDSVGINHPQQLLQDLGFQNRNLKLSQVISVLEEEIKMMNNLQESSSSHSLIVLFQAILCLYRCETKSLKLCLSHTAAERNKLKLDLSEANQRAILLAHEVDENHANMENIMKQNIKLLETKHTEAIKQMTEEFMSEKELSSLQISKLDSRLLSLEAEEIKLKSQISSLQDDNTKLEKELNRSQEQLFELTDIKNHLTKELKLLGERQQKQYNPVNENNVQHLENQLAKYHSENIALKDKNDELCTELDTLNNILSSCQPKKMERNEEPQLLDSFVMQMNPMNSFSSSNDTNSSLVSQIDGKDTCDHVNEAIPVNTASDVVESVNKNANNSYQPDLAVSVSDIKENKLNVNVSFSDIASEHIDRLLEFVKKFPLDQSDDILNNNFKPYVLCLYAIIKKITTNLSNLSKVDHTQDKDNVMFESDLSRVIHNIVNEILDIKHDTAQVDGLSNIFCKYVGTDQTLYIGSDGNESKPNEQLTSLKQEIDSLNECLIKERMERDEEKNKDAEKYQELESNMDLLRNEYFKCEEYWSTKLNEEREIFYQDQRITDEKFAELLTKLSEYEEQFTAQDNKADRFDGPLSTIEEKCHLEKQFNDLEDELYQYKTAAEKESRAKDLEISDLKEKIAKLEESVKNSLNCEKSQQVASIPNKEENESYNEIFSNKNMNPSVSEKDSNYINSPINYLWSQKAIPFPITNTKSTESQRDYHNPAYIKESHSDNINGSSCITPIQKPISSKTNVTEPIHENVIIKNGLEVKHEAKMLNCSDLEEALQGRRKPAQQVDGSRMKLEAEIPGFNTTPKLSPQIQNNSSILRTVALEIHCRQLQAALRQQQAYAESVFQQTVAAHRAEMGALKQRLAAADLLVRDLYVENCHLTRNINNPLLK